MPPDPAIDRASAQYRSSHKWLLWSIAGLVYGGFCSLEPNRFRWVRESELDSLLLLNGRGGFFLAVISLFGVYINWATRRDALRDWHSLIKEQQSRK